MSQTHYEIYRSEVLALTRSIVIKNSFIAEAINKSLKGENWPVKDEDPTTWKYYLNLAGQYHLSDTMMTVRSMDTREIIDFTIENLQIHRATAREYIPGSVYYRNLVNRYPHQADLINGIISPIDLQTAIDSQDGDILYFDTQYVESNEDTFKYDLQDWVKTFILSRFNQQYLITDDLYLPAFWGILYAHLPKAILSIRLANCKTNKVHSFHIREYLASHGALDAYIPYLTKEQQLFLYRNIEFLKRNAGKEYIWQRLIDRILTARGIPLIRYTLEQNLERMPEEVYPDVELVKHDINSRTVQPGQEKVAIDTLLGRENAIARENPLVRYDTEQEIIDQMGSAAFSALHTKVLDSEVVDRGNSNMRTLESILLNEWVDLAATNRYRAYVNVVDPSTGEYLALTPRDALIVALYAYARTRGLPAITIPKVNAYEVLRNPLPTHAELESIVDPKYMPKGMIKAIMDRITPLTEYISTEHFYKDCSKLHQEYLDLWELYSLQEHYMTRVYCQQAVMRHFKHIRHSLADDGMSYSQYFRELGVNIIEMSNADLEALLNEIIITATGSNLVTVISLGEIQANLLKLMGQLSSYPLQYLRNVASTDYRQMGVPAIRLGDISARTRSHDYVRAVSFGLVGYRVRGQSGLHITPDDLVPPITYSAATKTHLGFDPSVEVIEKFASLGTFRINISDVGLRRMSIVTEQTPVPDGNLTQYVPPS